MAKKLNVITIGDNEIPEAIRGPWTGQLLLSDGTRVKLGHHSDDVEEIIEAAILDSGAKTKEDVLQALHQLAVDMKQVTST